MVSRLANRPRLLVAKTENVVALFSQLILTSRFISTMQDTVMKIYRCEVEIKMSSIMGVVRAKRAEMGGNTVTAIVSQLCKM